MDVLSRSAVQLLRAYNKTIRRKVLFCLLSNLGYSGVAELAFVNVLSRRFDAEGDTAETDKHQEDAKNLGPQSHLFLHHGHSFERATGTSRSDRVSRFNHCDELVVFHFRQQGRFIAFF